ECEALPGECELFRVDREPFRVDRGDVLLLRERVRDDIGMLPQAADRVLVHCKRVRVQYERIRRLLRVYLRSIRAHRVIACCVRESRTAEPVMMACKRFTIFS